jgi:hypothetical protein
MEGEVREPNADKINIISIVRFSIQQSLQLPQSVSGSVFIIQYHIIKAIVVI